MWRVTLLAIDRLQVIYSCIEGLSVGNFLRGSVKMRHLGGQNGFSTRLKRCLVNIEIISSAVKFGTVRFARLDWGYGYVIPNGGGADVRLQIDAGRDIYAGVNLPEFTSDPAVPPCAGDQVVFTTKKFCRPGMWSIRDETAVWGYLRSYEVARKTIRNRPIFRVIRTALYSGTPLSEAPRGVVLGDGTLEQLRRRFSGNNLPTKMMDFTYIYRYEELVGERWMKTNDPELIAAVGGPPPMEVKLVSQTPAAQAGGNEQPKPTAVPKSVKPRNAELKSFSALSFQPVPA